MTTPADDLATEEAFEAFLVGRVVPEQAANTFDGVAAFAGAVRANATQPGRPNAALAELLATGLLTDQSSPSTRTAGAAGSPPSRRARVRRRRFAMLFPALLAKLLSAGAVAQAATGAGVVLVVATGAGATGLLGADVQDTITSVVSTDSGETATQDETADTDGTTSVDPSSIDSTEGDTSVAVAPAEEAFDANAWRAGPATADTFGEWVSQGAQNKDALRAAALKAGEDFRFGQLVSQMAAKKHLSAQDLAEEGVDLSDLTDEPTTEPVTDGTATDQDDATDDSEVASTQRGGSSTGHGTGGGNGGNSGGSSNGNGSGRGHN